MKSGSLRSIIPALLCAAVLLYAAFFFMNDRSTPEVSLPSPPVASDSLQNTDDLGQGRYTIASVTPETVQAVVGGTLERIENYTRSVTVERFWNGGSSTEQIDCHTRGGDSHLVITGSSDTKHVLILGDTLYLWYDSSPRSHAVSAAALSPDSNAADAFTGILTYEELLTLDSEQILDAGYTVFNNESCIWAEYRYGTLGYTSKVYISIATGLLMGAERYDGDSMIYRMTSDTPVIEIPADSWFTLPS